MTRRLSLPILVALLAAVAAIALTALLVNIFTRQQEARNPFYRVVELNDETVDPAVWGKNFPLQYDDQEAVRVLALSLDETRRGQASLPGSKATPGAQTAVK